MFGSREWFEEFVCVLNSDEEYAKAARNWKTQNDHRYRVRISRVDTRDQVRRTGPDGPVADRQSPRDPEVGVSHVRSGLLTPGRDELEPLPPSYPVNGVQER